jgi:adenylate cyclase class 2
MAFEIEAKARIENAEELELLTSLLKEGGRFGGKFHKLDSYFAPGGAYFENGKADSDMLIRLRYNGTDKEDRAVVTKKVKSFAGSVEVNRETEFAVDPAAAFEELLLSIGYNRYIDKEKRGTSYYFSGAHVELCNVSGLGWFIEIEIVIPEEGPEGQRDNAVEKLMAVFNALGISGERMEPRYYIEMLRDGETDENE